MHYVWSVWGFETRDSSDISVRARRGSACKKKVGLAHPCQLGPAVTQGKTRAKRVKRCEGVNRAEELGSMCLFSDMKDSTSTR